ncbi:MAG: hypothetical protein JSV19_13540 [Phycisphaerales bacterium]|nr:MAG: hypothetical protein JSV19_13540 [Phycisphaerales bacterium]
MNNHVGAACDEFYVNSRLHFKLETAQEQEPVLRFFERVTKAFPTMRKLRQREDGCVILEEEGPGRSSRRWLRIDPATMRFGYYAVPDIEEIRVLAGVILEHAPYYLNLSELNYDYLEVLYGFDLDYRGNHDQLLAETFWADHPFASLLLGEETTHVIESQPYLGVALNPECDLQAYAEVKSRTSTFEIRNGEFDEAPISIYLTVRQYWGFDIGTSLVETHRKMMDIADELAGEKVVPVLVNPLAHAIAGRL